MNYPLSRTGKDIITGTGSQSSGARYCRIHALATTVIASMTDATLKNGAMTGVTLTAGDDYDGDISAITLTSGTVIAYYYQAP